MNNQAQNNTPDTKSVKELGRQMSTPEALLLSFLALLLSAFLPISLFHSMQDLLLEGISVAAIGASILALYRMVGKSRPFFPTTISAVLAFFFIGAPTTALVLAFIMSVCSIAYVLLFADSMTPKIMCLVAVFVMSMEVADTAAAFTVALLPLVAALVLYYTVEKNLHKVSAICHISTVLLVFIFAIVAVKYVSANGTDLAVARDALESFREALTDLTAQMLLAVYDEISGIAELSMTDANEIAEISVNTMFNLLPAIAITLANAVAFFTHSMMLRVVFSDKAPSPTLKNMLLFDMSLISAIVFMASAILNLIFMEADMSIWLVTFENLVIILMPGMVLTAVMVLRGFTASKKGCAPSLIYFALIFALIYAPTVMLPLAAVAGAVVVILNNIAKHKLLKK